MSVSLKTKKFYFINRPFLVLSVTKWPPIHYTLLSTALEKKLLRLNDDYFKVHLLQKNIKEFIYLKSRSEIRFLTICTRMKFYFGL